MDPKIEGQEPIVSEKVVINGQEYDSTEAQTFIERGKQTLEAEKKWNTSLDKVWPEFGRLSQEKSAWEKQKADYESKLKTLEVKTEAGTETQADIDKAREAARKIGLTLNEDLDKSYIKRDDLEKLLTERETQREQVKKILDTADALVKEIDGKDGRPKFNKKAVLAYANTYNIADLKTAYEEMNSEQLEPWKKAELDKGKAPGLKTLGSGGKKTEPERVKLNDDNVGAALREAMSGNN